MKVKLAIVVEGKLKISFLIATTSRCRGGHYSFHWIAPLTLNTYLIMLSVKQYRVWIKGKRNNPWKEVTPSFTTTVK